MAISGYLGAVIAKRLIIKISISKFDLVLKALLTLFNLHTHDTSEMGNMHSEPGIARL